MAAIPNTMRALGMSGPGHPDVLVLGEQPVPELSAGEFREMRRLVLMK